MVYFRNIKNVSRYKCVPYKEVQIKWASDHLSIFLSGPYHRKTILDSSLNSN